MRILDLIRQKLISLSNTKFLYLIYKEIDNQVLGVTGLKASCTVKACTATRTKVLKETVTTELSFLVFIFLFFWFCFLCQNSLKIYHIFFVVFGDWVFLFAFVFVSFQEKHMGITPSEMMDRDRACIPKLQIDFLDAIALPVYRQLHFNVVMQLCEWNRPQDVSFTYRTAVMCGG